MIEGSLMVVALFCSYLLGSIPTGFLFGKAKGLDIRKVGSGNMGATNVTRVLGFGPGITVLIIDVVKGFIAAYFLARLTPYGGLDWLKVGCGLAAVLGHTFTLFLKFKGGKGVATAAGVFLGLAPISMGLALILFITVVALSRYISAGSIIAALVLPILIFVFSEVGQGYSVFIIACILSLVIVIRHRTNIKRILNGTENKFGDRIKVEGGKQS